jgi:hypothetical protein
MLLSKWLTSVMGAENSILTFPRMLSEYLRMKVKVGSMALNGMSLEEESKSDISIELSILSSYGPFMI